MSQTYQFTLNQDDSKVDVVLNKIESFKRDEFSECTTIRLISGKEYGVKEDMGKVRSLVQSAI